MSNKNNENNEIKIELELGYVIEIFDPTNEILNGQTFYIDYIDKTKMFLINVNTLEKIKLPIRTDGIIGDGTINKIIIKSKSNEKGYARQHQLLPGTCINIYFGGDLPLIITGEITNLENDMIEIKMVDGDVIYINFDYKGIPEDLPIDFIEIREKPCVAEEPVRVFETGVDTGVDTAYVEEPIEELLPELTREENAEPIQLQIPVEQVKTQIREFIIKADQIQFGNEVLGPIVQFVDIYGKSERYSIETQTNDLLDELLSTIPNAERTNRVLNNIHTIIDRFVQLRESFSTFDEYGNISNFITYKSDYKPLSKYFENFNTNLLWILPVVKNIKKIYVENLVVTEEEQNDVINIRINDDLENMKSLLDNYRANNLPNEENKYSSLYKELNPYFTPFDEINEEYLNEILIEKQTNIDINVIIDNLGDFYSSVFANNLLNTKRFVIQKYNLGLTKLDATNLKGSRFESVRVKLTQNDDLYLKSVMTLPEPFIRFSQINLPGTNILNRANLNSIFIDYWQLLKKNANVEIITVDNIRNEIEYEENNFVNNIKNYVNNISEDDKRESGFTKQEIYEYFVDTIVPKTRVLFNLMKKYINGKLSLIDVVSYLEPFLVYTDNLTYVQYKLIIQFINEKISEYNKNFLERSKIFYGVKNYKTTFGNKPLPFDAFPVIHILTEKNNLRKDVFDDYDIPINTSELIYTNSELLRKVTLKDYSRLYSAALSIQSIPLKYPDQFNSLFEDDKLKLRDDIENDKKNDSCSDKSNHKTIAKLYFSRDELLNDNDKQIYFDKKYDDTNYGLIDDFEKEMMTKTPEEFIIFLTNKLKNDKKLSDEDAEYMADALISGYKKVLNGQYAILKLLNENGPYFEYYVRKNNEWILDPNQKDIEQEQKSGISDSNILCNLQEKCISIPEKIGDKCESMEISKMELQQNVLKDILNEFDQKYYETKEEFEEKINKKYTYLFEILRIVGRLETENMLKYNNQRYKIGYKIDDGYGNGTSTPVIVSPFAKYRDLILGQSDFIKKQHDIIKFVKICTRPFIEDGLGPLGTRENPHWLYCIETGVELMPTFKYNLACGYLNDTSNYNDFMELIIKQIGVLSDDGDKWVDKYSGYTIKYIDLNVEEGYEGGFRISTRGVLEEDAGNKLVTLSDKNITLAQVQKNALRFETPESKMISNVVTALSVAIGINIEYQKEFIINGVTEVLKNTMPKEEDYKKRIKELSNKPNAKVPMSFEDLYYTSILYYTLGMFLIAVQTSIPSVKTRKTFPGCVRSFVGYPFDGAGDMTSLKYLSCICYQIRKNVAKPWYVLKNSKEEYIANKISLVINEYLLKLPDVKQKMNEKNEYLLLNPEEEIPKEHNVANWIEFLPPISQFKIKNLVNISSEFKQTLLQNIKSGSKKQEEQILVVNSKIIQFSLAIQERIQEIVKKKDLTLSKINNEYYLENSCCQEKNIDQKSTIAYFEKEDPRITDYNKIVENLTNILQDITNYSKAELLYSPINTKNIYPAIKKEFDNRTISYAFIHFCHFNSLLPIPEDLLPLCNEKPMNMVSGIGESRDEIAKKLKENGVNYSLESFLRMLQIVSRNNIIDIDIYKPIITSLRKLNALLEEMENENEEIVEPSLRKLLLNAMDTFSIASDVTTPQIKDLNNFLVKQTNIMKLDVIDFINQNKGSDVTRKQLKNVMSFIDVISEWKTEETNIYSFIKFFQSFIENFTKIFPNIILNKVDYKENIIPNYLGLSKNHQKKIKDDISHYYEKLRIFYDVPSLINILQNIQKSCDNLLKLSKNTPSFATTHKNGKELKPIFDERTSKLLFEYYFFRILLQYTYLCDDDKMIVREMRETQEVQDLFTVDYIDETNASLDIVGVVGIENDVEEDITVLRGNKRELKTKVANLLIEFLSIMETHKDVVDISYDDVLDRIFKLKEKEKDIMTDRLKFMTDEERDADTILKVNKLGMWSKGLQKGLTTYVKENYDEEREFMEQMLQYEKQAQIKLRNSNLDANSAGFVLDDFIDEMERDAEIEREAYDMSGYTEYYMDGEFEGDEVENYDDFE
jgi:hypothetical protein